MADPQPQPVGEDAGMPSIPADANPGVPGSPPPVREDAPTIISKGLSSRSGAENNFAVLLKGRRLAHFELEEAIGVGGMAAVIKAVDTQLDRNVALKILPPEMAADPENVQRFHHEARAAAKLDHENVARVFFCGEDQGLHFIAFEFVEGQNLRAMIDRRGRLPVAEAIHYVLQIATGLAHAAARGVVHRDIKPSNIIIDENGRAKLVDMGLARSRDPRMEKGLTQSGVTLGTFDYISPEQALEPREADVRSDIYSLGCTFYHMLTGQLPVPEGTAARKLQFHQQGAPIDPRQLNPEIPDEVAAILSKMMAKDPKDRYQRAEYLVQHLVMVAQKLGSTTMNIPQQNVVFAESILPSPPRVRPLLVVASGCAAVVVLVMLLGVIFNTGPNGTSPRVNSGAPGHGGGLPESPGSSRPPVVHINPAVGTPEPVSPRVSSIEELRKIAGENKSGDVTLEPGTRYDLTAGLSSPMQDPALIFTNANLTLKTEPDVPRSVIRLTCNPALAAGREWAALKIVGGTLTLRRIRFEIDSRAAVLPASILLVQGGQLILEDCEFVQEADNADSSRTSVVKVTRAFSGSSTAKVDITRCYFAGGEEALTLEDAARVDVKQSWFAPYRQPIRVQGKDPAWRRARDTTALTLTECSWLLQPGSVVLMDGQKTCHVTATRCIFSRPGQEGQPANSPVALLLLGPDQELEKCQYTGEANGYHNITALVAGTTEQGEWRPLIERVTPFEQARGIQDTRPRYLKDSPWAVPDPISALAGAGVRAFEITLPDLHEGGLAIGARLGESQPRTVPTPVPPRPAISELIVDRNGPYKSIASAFGAAESDEVIITIRINGVLTEMPLEIGKKKVTIRAAEGFRPVLSLNLKKVPGADGEAALFLVHDGDLTLENLDFRLRPLELAKLESLVAISGSGGCHLKHCLATLEGVPDGPRMALAAVADPTGTMMGSPTKPRNPGALPAVELVETFVRGQGDLLAVRVSRPYRLDIRDSLIALHGSLVSEDGNKQGMTMPSEGAVVALDRVTAYLTQHLLVTRSNPSNPLHVPVKIESTACILASAEGRPLLSIQGPETPEAFRSLFSWKGQRNIYSSPTNSMLIWQPLNPSLMPHRYDHERWLTLWGTDDDQARFTNLTFTGPLSSDRLVQASPADFTLPAAATTATPDLSLTGADLNRLLPPTSEPPNEE